MNDANQTGPLWGAGAAFCGPQPPSPAPHKREGVSEPPTSDGRALRAIHALGVGPVVEVPRRPRWFEDTYPQPARDVNPARWVTDPPIPYGPEEAS